MGENPRPVTPRGLAVFLRAGMVAWTIAHKTLRPVAACGVEDRLVQEKPRAATLHSEVATVVAGMILSAWRGGIDQ